MKTFIASAALAAFAIAPSAFAEEHRIEMRNIGPDAQPMVFSPSYVEAAVGDTIVIVNAMGAHNAQTIPGLWPEGAETFVGAMNEDVTFTVTAEGLYGVKCLPHYEAGMVALIRVGEGTPSNLEAAQAIEYPGRAATRMAAMLAQVE